MPNPANSAAAAADTSSAAAAASPVVETAAAAFAEMFARWCDAIRARFDDFGYVAAFAMKHDAQQIAWRCIWNINAPAINLRYAIALRADTVDTQRGRGRCDIRLG